MSWKRITIAIAMVLILGSTAWPENLLFPPGSPPGRWLDRISLEGESADVKLAAITLQGQVNSATQSSVYLVLAGWDNFWLQWLKDRGTIEGWSNLNLDTYFSRYSNAYRKIIIYDPNLPATINIATMIASLEQGIVVAPGDTERFGAGKEVEDLRGRWTRNVDAYRWAFENLWPRMNQQILACYHPNSIPHHLRDYLIRNRVFTFWITGKEKEDGIHSSFDLEKAFVEELLAASPVNIPVIGFWFSGADPGINEYTGVGLGGEYGKITVVYDWGSNSSLLSGVAVDFEPVISAYREQLRPSPALDHSKTYIAFDIVESGDSPGYVQDVQYDVWKDPQRGAIPIGWSLGPGVFELAPPVAEWFFKNAGPNDYFYTAISGAGYVHPYRNFMTKVPDPDAGWQGYLQLTDRYMQLMQCNELGLYTDAWLPFNRQQHDAVTLRFAEGIPRLTNLILGMGRDGELDGTDGNYLIGTRNVLVSHILTRWPPDYASYSREDLIQYLVNDILTHAPRQKPGFMQVMALSWAYRPSEIVEAASRLGTDYIPVSARELDELYREAMEMSPTPTPTVQVNWNVR